MSTEPAWELRDTACAIALAVAATAAVVLAIMPYPAGVFQDDGAYVVLAKSLAQGSGYRFINLPNAPAATHFPPIYPLWLAFLWKLGPAFPGNIQFFKMVNALLLGAAAAAAFAFARRKLVMGTWSAAAATAAATICAPLVFLSSMVLSEPAFLATLFPVLLLSERAVHDGGARTAVAAGIAGGLLGLLRTLGVFALPATALLLIARRRWRDAGIVLLGGLLILAPWQLWTLAHGTDLPAVLNGKYGSYFGWYVKGVQDGGVSFVAAVARINTLFSANFLAATFGFAGSGWAIRTVMAVVALVLLALGAREMWRRAPVTTLFLGLYLGVVLVWPFPPDRFYWAVWPFVVFAFALGVRRALGAVPQPRRWYRGLGYAATAALAVMYARTYVFGTPRLWIADVQTNVADRSRAIVEWVNANAEPNDIIATEDDILVYLYTGHVTVPAGTFIPREYVSPQTHAFASSILDSLLHDYPVRWVVPASAMGINASLGLTRREPPLLALRQRLRLGAVFERVPTPGAEQ